MMGRGLKFTKIPNSSPKQTLEKVWEYLTMWILYVIEFLYDITNIEYLMTWLGVTTFMTVIFVFLPFLLDKTDYYTAALGLCLSTLGSLMFICVVKLSNSFLIFRGYKPVFKPVERIPTTWLYYRIHYYLKLLGFNITLICLIGGYWGAVALVLIGMSYSNSDEEETLRYTLLLWSLLWELCLLCYIALRIINGSISKQSKWYSFLNDEKEYIQSSTEPIELSEPLLEV